MYVRAKFAVGLVVVVGCALSFGVGVPSPVFAQESAKAKLVESSNPKQEEQTKPQAEEAPKTALTRKSDSPAAAASGPVISPVKAPAADVPVPAEKIVPTQPVTRESVAPVAPKALAAPVATKESVVPAVTKEQVVPAATKAPPSPAATKETASAPAKDAAPAKTPNKEAAVPAPVVAPATPPEWHRMQLRLSGSMCLACLKELEDNIKKLPGIDRAKIERPQTNYIQAISPDVSSWAQGVVIYDGKRMPTDYLKEALRQNGYHPYHISERILDRAPEDRDMKIKD